jgi:NAD(P)-dependent dehydrogenase (short-subunit alcohol dehydrogenase family)
MNGKHVVVTGGTGALGAGVVEVLLARGATIHLPMIETETPAHLRHERVHATPRVALDDDAQVTAYYASLPPLWASIHLVGGFAMAPITQTSLAELDKQWRLNTVTCFLACREAVRSIRQSQLGGRIVNVAARPVVQPAGGMVAYVAAKAAVASITQSLGVELVDDKILVNAVLPSIIDTAANRKSMPDADHARWPKPNEIGETIGFLASPENSLTTGTLVPVYGRA